MYLESCQTSKIEQALLIFKMDFLKFGIPFKTKINHILGTCNFEQVVISRNLVS